MWGKRAADTDGKHVITRRVISRIRPAAVSILTTMSTFTTLVALSLSAAAAATPLSTFPHSPPPLRSPFSLAPLIQEDHIHGSINDSYIVMLKDGMSPSLMENHFNFLQMAHSEEPLIAEAAGLQQVYSHINAYHALLSEGTVERLRAQPEVEYIEVDQVVKTTEFAVHEISDISQQKGAPWVSHSSAVRDVSF